MKLHKNNKASNSTHVKFIRSLTDAIRPFLINPLFHVPWYSSRGTYCSMADIFCAASFTLLDQASFRPLFPGANRGICKICTALMGSLYSHCYYYFSLWLLAQGLKVETVPWRFTEKERLKFASSDKVGSFFILRLVDHHDQCPALHQVRHHIFPMDFWLRCFVENLLLASWHIVWNSSRQAISRTRVKWMYCGRSQCLLMERRVLKSPTTLLCIWRKHIQMLPVYSAVQEVKQAAGL